MNKHKLSMRYAHGEMDTFLVGLGEMITIENVLKKTAALLKFRHTQYAPFGEGNALKNNAFFKDGKMACSVRLLQHRVQAAWLLVFRTLQTTLQENLKCR